MLRFSQEPRELHDRRTEDVRVINRSVYGMIVYWPEPSVSRLFSYRLFSSMSANEEKDPLNWGKKYLLHEISAI